MSAPSDNGPGPRVTAPPTDRPSGSVDAAEVAHFEALAAEWWDPDGRFRQLHRFNPERVRFVRDRAAARFGRDAEAPTPLAGLRVLDVGTGGGIVAEPMARLGAAVTGIDPSEKNVGIARAHAAQSGLAIDYRATTAEDLAAAGERYDLVLALEVVEHVADIEAFMDAAAALVAPGGAFAAGTLNRTLRSWLLAIVGAEYVMRWLPVGTHDWNKFLTPAELANLFAARGLSVTDACGMVYNPVSGRWRLADDTGVNYLMFAVRD